MLVRSMITICGLYTVWLFMPFIFFLDEIYFFCHLSSHLSYICVNLTCLYRHLWLMNIKSCETFHPFHYLNLRYFADALIGSELEFACFFFFCIPSIYRAGYFTEEIRVEFLAQGYNGSAPPGTWIQEFQIVYQLPAWNSTNQRSFQLSRLK